MRYLYHGLQYDARRETSIPQRGGEGTLRGLEREMTQQEIVRAMKRELKESISQSYLSQIESGARRHLTNDTRLLLSRFFKVHPGYLVDDPEGYHTELVSDLRSREDQLDLWLIEGAERFRNDPKVSSALLDVARHEDSRKCLVLLQAVLDTPGLLDRLINVLNPQSQSAPRRCQQQRLCERRTQAGYMTWEAFYLICFLVGLLLSLVSVMAQSGHFHAHHGHLHFHQGDCGGSMLPKINFGTITAFLAWFGGSGYLLHKYTSFWTLVALAVAAGIGLVGAAIVFWFAAKLMAHDRTLDPADFDMIGVLGRVSSTVRVGGVGEMVFHAGRHAPRNRDPRRNQ